MLSLLLPGLKRAIAKSMHSRHARRIELQKLESRIIAVTGQDRELDRLLTATLANGKRGGSVLEYSSSVDACLALVGEILPGWHWHIGHGPDGVLPYAALRKDIGTTDDELNVEAIAPTVPLALLHAIVKALLVEQP